MFNKYLSAVKNTESIKYLGHVTAVQGTLIESLGPRAAVGELCQIVTQRGKTILTEVAAVRDKTVQLMAFEPLRGLEIGDVVVASGAPLEVPMGQGMLGRVLDALGRPMDGRGPFVVESTQKVQTDPPLPMERVPIKQKISTGIRAVDGLIPLGRGQRVGIFAGSGVGKSVLLGMIARNTTADINVVALIGERGREVREFIENDLGEEGLKRSVLVVSTSDTPALARVRGAFTATAIAEYFRDQGKNVMLLFDSVTRFAMSQREIGLSIGEPPATRSYTPSVFALMPKLLERSGASRRGTITGIYSVLVEGDDMDEPVSDAARGYLDGHIVLSRALASRNHYPAIDVLESVSRLGPKIMSPLVNRAAGKVKKMMAVYKEKEDLIDVGAYVKGSDPEIDEAIEKRPEMESFLTQGIEEKATPKETFEGLSSLSGIPLKEEEQVDETVSVFA